MRVAGPGIWAGSSGGSFELVEGTFADGSGNTLRRPVYRIDAPNYGHPPCSADRDGIA